MVWRMALTFAAETGTGSREDKVAVVDLTPGHESSARGRAVATLWAAIDLLPESLRLVVVLTSIQEHGVKDVALLMQLPEAP
jgi:DNA-directed RNA polymerase specialized sigma24 family protein